MKPIIQMVTKNIWTVLMIGSALGIFGIGQSVVAQTTNTFPSTGNAGIGTTTPAATDALAIVGSNSGRLSITLQNTSSVGNASLYLFNDSGGNAYGGLFTGGSADAHSNILSASRANKTIILADGANSTGLSIGTLTAQPLVFGTNNTERMRIDSSGNVGIGTASPGQILDVRKDQNAATSINVTNTTSGGSAIAQFAAYTDSGHFVGFSAESAGYNLIPGWASSGAFYTDLPIFRIVAFNANNSIRLSAGGLTSDQLVVDGASGNVGIGRTNPTYLLDVAGTVRSSSGGFRFPDNTVQTSAVNYGSSAGTAVQGNISITLTAGDGMSGGGPLTLGAGGTLTLTNADKGSAQSIFKNVANASGTTQFSAASNNDAVRFDGTGGASVSFDASTKKVTVDASSITSSQWTTSGSNINYGTSGGNVGVGQSNPTYKLDVNGTAHVSGNMTVDGNLAAKYQDLAEWVPASEQLPAGTVVVLDATKSNQVIASTVSYDTRVAGVISEQPGIALGERTANKVLVATTGRVRVKVDATRAPIHVGDLLVTSDTPGVAMKSEPVNLGGVQLHRPGTLIGKALEPLAKGSGEILVLLSLQ